MEDIEWVQKGFGFLLGIFERFGIHIKGTKFKSMVCHP